MIMGFTRIPTSTTIPPGEQRSFDIRLPGCQVLSDPCTERVAIKVILNENDPRAFQAVISEEESYQFVPGPTATFEITDLRGNRPVLVTQGDAHGSLRQDVLRVAFATMPGPPAAIPNLSDVFSSRGLEVKSWGGGDNTASVDIGGVVSPANQAVVDAAIGDVERANRGATLVTRAYMQASDAFDPLITTSRDGDEAAANRLARLLDASPVHGVSLLGDNTQVLLPARDYSAPNLGSHGRISYPMTRLKSGYSGRLQGRSKCESAWPARTSAPRQQPARVTSALRGLPPRTPAAFPPR